MCECVSVYVSYAYTMPHELVGFKAHIHNNANIHRNRFRGTMIGENSLTQYSIKTSHNQLTRSLIKDHVCDLSKCVYSGCKQPLLSVVLLARPCQGQLLVMSI